MSRNRFSYPCRVKQREDGTYFIRFPDIPEAIVDGVEEANLYREASKCLGAVLYWRITNEVELPVPSQLRDGQLLIELSIAQSLSDAIEKGRLTMVDSDEIDAALAQYADPEDQNQAADPAAPGDNFVPIAVAAE